MEPAGSTIRLIRSPGPHDGALGHLGGEEGAPVGGDERRAVAFVGRRPHRVDVDRRRVDREEHVRRRAELLDDSRLDLDRRRSRCRRLTM